MAEIVATIQAQQMAWTVEVVWIDESHFMNDPYVQRGWCRKGTQVKVPTPTKRQSTTLFGALHLRTQRFYWKRAERGTSKMLLEFLHPLHQRFPEALLLVILDNAKLHKGRAVKRFLEQGKKRPIGRRSLPVSKIDRLRLPEWQRRRGDQQAAPGSGSRVPAFSGLGDDPVGLDSALGPHDDNAA